MAELPFRHKILRCCGVIDAQGQMIDKTFKVLELAICGEKGYREKVMFDSGLRQSDIERMKNPKILQTIKYTEKNVHGLPLQPFSLWCARPQSSLTEVIQSMYVRATQPGKELLAVKNHQLLDILREAGIPCFSLDFEGTPVPSYRDLMRKYEEDSAPYPHCGLHKVSPRNTTIICSSVKAQEYWRYVGLAQKIYQFEERLLY